MFLGGRQEISAAGCALRRRGKRRLIENQDRWGFEFAYGQHYTRQEYRGWAYPRGFHDVRARPLDQLATARTRGHARRALRLLRHARAGVWRAIRLHESRRAGI